MKKCIVAITGASGSLYAERLLARLARQDAVVHAVISEAGRKVLAIETGKTPAQLDGVARWFDAADFTAPMASGSCRYDAMVVVPCTMGTLAAIASGNGRNLIHRAADVMLKERRPLILAVRETPLSRVHLQNMLAAHDAGAVICPAMPAFYTQPTSLTEMADQYAGRLAELMGFAVDDLPRWQGSGSEG
ncbi:MAG: UbiX family flavin prenyltransferase [Thermodesulfobacteriota bacterium]